MNPLGSKHITQYMYTHIRCCSNSIVLKIEECCQSHVILYIWEIQSLIGWQTQWYFQWRTNNKHLCTTQINESMINNILRWIYHYGFILQFNTVLQRSWKEYNHTLSRMTALGCGIPEVFKLLYTAFFDAVYDSDKFFLLWACFKHFWDNLTYFSKLCHVVTVIFGYHIIIWLVDFSIPVEKQNDCGKPRGWLSIVNV